MELEAAIVAMLKDDSAINTLLGGRLAPTGMPANLATPYVVYQRLGTQRRWSNDGPTGNARGTIQLTIYGATYADAKAVVSQLRKFDGFTGTITGSGSSGDLTIESMLLDDERDAPAAAPPAGQSKGLPGILMIFRITYRG